MKSRWVQTKDGDIQEHAWVFNDIGIATILDKLVLSNTGKNTREDESAMIAAMEGAGISAETDIEREENKKVGQIEVKISRVVLGRKSIHYPYRPKHQEGEREDVDMDATDPELTHTTGSVSTCHDHVAVTDDCRLMQTKAAVSCRIPVVNYELYDEKEDSYATFKFFYRSQG